MLLQFLVTIFLLILLPLLFLITETKLSYNSIPKSYPLLGSFIALFANQNRRLQWLSDILQASPSVTFVLRRSYATRQVFKGNPAMVQHIVKTHFYNYNLLQQNCIKKEKITLQFMTELSNFLSK